MSVPGFANRGTYLETSFKNVQMMPVGDGSGVEVRQTRKKWLDTDK